MVLEKVLIVINFLVWSANSEYQETSSLCCTAANGINYPVNTTFTTTDCLSKCVCTHDAHLGCIPLCPSSVSKCPIGYKRGEIMSPAGAKESGCFCKKVICKALSYNAFAKTGYCQEGNNFYKPGEEFIKNCTKLCRCYKKGQARCVPLCPDDPPCPVGTTEIKVQIPIEYNHDKCKCKTKVCKALPIKDECLINGRVYKAGEDFISADCSGSCKCHPGGRIFCISLCPPEAISCGHNEATIKLLRKIPNSNCTCSIWRCLRNQQQTKVIKKQEAPITKGTCTSKSGNIYQIGQVFIDQNCTLKCHCQDHGKLTCEPLCPDFGDTQDCAPENKTIIHFTLLLPHGDGKSSCSCPVQICEPNVDTCIVGDYIYKPGDDFVSPDCSGYCRCYPGGSVLCANLCSTDEVTCQPDEDKMYSLSAIPNSNCTCTTWKCVKRPLEDKCYVGEHIYQPGDDFVSADCSGYCKCHPGGTVFCKSLCPPSIIACADDEEAVQVAQEVSGTNCTCPSWKCLKKSEAVKAAPMCISQGGYVYKVGQEFTDQNCTSRCQCAAGGKIACQPLCFNIMPQDDAPCGKKTIRDMPVTLPDDEGNNCSCPITLCEKTFDETTEPSHNDTCTMGEYTYRPGEDFVSADCSGYCKCHPEGSILCVSLCPPEGITCQQNEEAVQLSRQIANSNCTCPTWKCIKKKDQCLVDGHVYNSGEDFISDDCLGRCKCLPGQAVACKTLCPPEHITCQLGEVKEQLLEQIPNSNCSCPKWKCLKKEVDEFCVINGEKHKVGERFVDSTCTGYCRCYGPRAIGCVSLCPPMGYPPCNPGEVEVEFQEPVLGSNCTCQRWKCAKESGNWTRWANWTACDAPCGGGRRYKYRSCKSGSTCVGSNQEEEVCNLTPCSAEFCIFNGEKHKVGERFVDSTCTGYCRCYGPRAIACVSLCPPMGYPPCNPGEVEVEFQEPVLGSNCTCQRWKCAKESGNWTRWANWTACDAPCGGGRRYKYRSCKSGSTCVGSNQEEEVCNLTPCSAEFCVINGEKYKVGERFVDSTCTGYCRCYGPRAIGCVSLCPPVGNPPCNPGEVEVEFQEPVLGSNCTCQRWKCAKESGNWTRWSNWTACDAPCGGGRRYKYRSCKSGSACVGSNQEDEICNLTPCSVSYSINLCGSSRMKAKTASIWPRCDDNGFYEPLQCQPNIGECWCVDKWGKEVQGSRLSSQIPQC